LYNWHAVNNAAGLAYLKRNGVQEVAWRVPTNTDFSTLSTYLGGDTVSGGKLKEVGITHWETPNTGADNSSIFTSLPSGIRAHTGPFVNIFKYNYLFTSTQFNSGNAYWRQISYDSILFESFTDGLKNYGGTVRLVKDV
jgi:uncharacterized protein (TIGR02145 family)